LVGFADPAQTTFGFRNKTIISLDLAQDSAKFSGNDFPRPEPRRNDCGTRARATLTLQAQAAARAAGFESFDCMAMRELNSNVNAGL
jgi:hypothetical protein